MLSSASIRSLREGEGENDDEIRAVLASDAQPVHPGTGADFRQLSTDKLSTSS